MENLENCDPELYDLIREEEVRQREGLELIASENFTSKAVMECLGSVLTNKYSEGLPGARYYGGNEVIDKIETLCIERCLAAFNLDSEKWGVNVQPYSGSVANMAAYAGVLQPHDRIMGLDLPSGGHLTHGYYTSKRKISATSIFYESMPYHIDNSGYIDYDELAHQAKIFKPKLIICGASAYPRDFDYDRFRQVADDNGAYLLCDMAHISGLVATNEAANPFYSCDIVTSTTHKTLRGPRAGLIFYRRELTSKINNSVFPGLQGGPHEHQIAAIATQMREVMQPQFKTYIQNVKKNAAVLAREMRGNGYILSTGGTDNHLILVDLRPLGITGNKVEKLCEYVNISINKNAIFGDESALKPGGIRIGTAALTTRNFKEAEFIRIAIILHQCIEFSLKIQKKVGKKLADFVKEMHNMEELRELRREIIMFARNY